jgi:lipid-binding SYLF domain-containing protein/osmotically-inducible protein OsmY
MNKTISVIATLLLLLATTAFAADDRAKEVERVQAAGNVLQEIMKAPDKGIPREILASAECVAVVPSMLKGGFIFGASYGKGVATCHTPHGWSAPAPFRIEGGSWGLQIGGQETDLVMLIMNEKGMRNLLNSKFELGADASAAAGPVGRDVEGNTDWKMRAQVLTYSRARGAFAGITLNGAVVKQDEDDTHLLYGRMVPFSRILTGKVQPPAGTLGFVQDVARYFKAAKTDQEAEKRVANESTTTASKPQTGGGTAGAAATSTPRTNAPSTAGSIAGNASASTGVAQPSGSTQATPETNAGVQAGNTAPQPVSDQDLRSQIQKNFRDTPGFSSSNITVDVTNDAVVLAGSVPSEADKQTARKLAQQSANGRRVIDDNLLVK